MFEKIRNCLNEVINIADQCPEKYQVKCFEILLDALVKGEAVAAAPAIGVEVPGKRGVDFFQLHNISKDEWTRVYHFDGSSYSIIVKDLRERPTSKKQVKLALLLGIKSLLEMAEATVSKESLIDICKQYATYDAANFAAHIKKQKNLFLPKGDGWLLTMPGQDRAAEVIKELAQ
jgi:hypothetical protein